MLRITLNKDDYVMIGDNIRLNYERNTGKDSFAFGISAPKDVKILRKNLYEDNKEDASGVLNSSCSE